MNLMTYEEIKQYLSSKSDDDIIRYTKQATIDLKTAAIEEHSSDWHNCCYAATLLLFREMEKRKLVVTWRIE